MKKFFFFVAICTWFCLSSQAQTLTIIVSSTNDSGPGTLRQAILNANAHTGSAVDIFFSIGFGEATIYLTSPLPVITHNNVFISIFNGSSSPLFINGNNMPGPVFRYSGTVRGSFVRGVNFSPANYTVTTTANSGSGSLPEILRYCEQTLAKDYISFNIPGAAPHTFPLYSSFSLNSSVSIDGTTQPANGYTGTMPKIVFDKVVTIDQPCEIYGITFTKNSGLRINGGARLTSSYGYADGSTLGRSGGSNVFLSGITVYQAADLTFQNNYVGMDVQSAVESNLSNGLYLIDTKNAKILNNYIGNCNIGFRSGRDTNTVIRGNKIGTDVSGLYAVPNGQGVLCEGSVNLTIGGASAGQGNLISGNVDGGISCGSVKQAFIQGNYIGTDITGMLSLPNNKVPRYSNAAGLYLSGCDSAIVGGNTANAANVIASNTGHSSGYEIVIAWSNRMHLYGNKIGVAKDGVTLLGKNGGIYVEIQSTVVIGKVGNGYGNIFSSFNYGVSTRNYNILTDYQSNVSIRGNSFFNNATAVFSIDGSTPIITNVTSNKVEGYADPSAIVDLYYHNGTGEFQGKTYFATVTANATGNWTYNGIISNACSITAAATKNGRTTKFSQQYKFGNAGPDLRVCKGSSPIMLSASGGSDYSWAPATGLSSTTIANPVFQPDTTQTYIVSLTNSLGCTGSDTLTVHVEKVLSAPTLLRDTLLCTEDSLLLNPGNYPSASFLWSTGKTSPTIYGKPGNSYTVAITNTCGTVNGAVVIGIANCGEISGTVYEEYGGNCTLDITDIPVKQKLVKLMPGPLYAVTDTQGHYKIKVPYNTYDLSFLPVEGRTQICHTGNYTVTLNNTTPAYTGANFTLLNTHTVNGKVNISSNPLIVGRPFTYTVVISNEGIDDLNGQLLFHYDPQVIFLSSDVTITDHTHQVLTVDYSGIEKGESLAFNLNFSVPPDATLFGKYASFLAELPLGNDFDTSDNEASSKSSIRASYDPNTKGVSPAGATDAGLIPAKDSILQYIIYFQNEGNAAADSITIIDTLSQHLNIETFTPLYASHTYSVDIIGNNILKWTFRNINLAPKNEDEAGSQGYLQFKVHALKDLLPGTEIINSAEIYFDYNPAIKTNTVLNTIAYPLTGATAFRDLSCAETGTIALAAVPQGGIPPYTYAWDNGLPSDSLVLNLSNGTYSCTITDASEETFEISANVSEPAALSATSTVTNASCIGNNDGAISITAYGGSGSYSFSWNDGSAGINVSELVAGTYTVTITDSDDCSSDISFVVNESAVTCATTGTAHETSVAKISAYPNPAKDLVTFEVLTSEKTFSLLIKDMTGKEVFRKENISGTTYSLSKNNIGTGVFLYTIDTDNTELGKGKLIILE